MRSTTYYSIYQLVHHRSMLFFILLIIACQPKNEFSGQLNQESASSHTGHGAHAMPSEKDEEVNRLQAELMTIHDELMLKMDELMQLKRKGKQTLLVLDSLHKTNPEKEHGSAEKHQLEKALQKLAQTDEAMMDWMRRYDHKMEGKSEAEKQNYLQKEKDKLLGIKEEMLQSIETAKQLLK